MNSQTEPFISSVRTIPQYSGYLDFQWLFGVIRAALTLREYLSHLGNIATANDLSKGTGTSHVAYYVTRITCLMWRGFLRLL